MIAQGQDAQQPLGIGRAPLRDLVRPGQQIAISVCDVTRPQPRASMLRAIFDEALAG